MTNICTRKPILVWGLTAFTFGIQHNLFRSTTIVDDVALSLKEKRERNGDEMSHIQLHVVYATSSVVPINRNNRLISNLIFYR